MAGLECVDCHPSSEMHNELSFVRVPQVTVRVFLLGLLLASLAVVTVIAGSSAVDLVTLGVGVTATGAALFVLGKGR